MNVNNEKEIFKCEICGNIVSIVEVGGGELVCCGEPMKLLEEKTSAEEGKEKHVPVIENNNGLIRIKLGEIPHPMEVGHYIEWIEIIANGKTYKKYLTEGDDPEFTFVIDAENVIARAYCNVHGLWKSQL